MAPAAGAVLRRAHLAGVHSLVGRRPHSGDRVSVHLPWRARCRAFHGVVDEGKVDLLKILKSANTVIPHIVLGSTILALVYPPSFTWFTTRYYAPALGFLMFAVGVNSSPKDFIEAIKRPDAIFAGYIGQFIIKPLLGFLFGTVAVTIFNLPTALDPHMAPLSIIMTSLSTASAVFVTPTLSYLLIGKKLPVDVKGMMSSIVQIVVAPIAAGLLLNRFLPRLCAAIQPFLPPLSVFVTALCVGSPLAINIKAVLSPFGLAIVLLLFAFHASSFVAGYHLAGTWFHKSADVKAVQRTISFETGMQSSLLALALANKFFPDPLVGVPPAVSVVLMSLMGFALVMRPLLLRRHLDGSFQRQPSAVRLASGVALAAAAVTAAAAPPALAALSEPANALSLPTWAVHVSSVAEWVTAMWLVWDYGERTGLKGWKGLSWGMVPLLGGAMCACTWHFFYNSESLDVLVALQGALTVIGNITMCIAAYRIFKASKEGSQSS
ncbi:hypothetical protein PR202_ga16367 [Eleusine coracana subsp. coracana]|uniref:Uncharacterized protein n=1 Tax=Eleusine coracana subsp. coracana TaxID=191504 RepID=A0AAV5CML3_ELECO|nr:hypothetical protein PR202_ga16367 [Eleusine coracana subsp. coracana]